MSMTEPGTISFPPYDWLPRPTQLADTAATLLALVGAALDSFQDEQGNPRGARYTRRLYSFGDVIPWWQVNDQGGQILVTMNKLYMGTIGRPQYQSEGIQGTNVQQAAMFTVEVVNSWPVLGGGGISPEAPGDDDYMEAAYGLYTDGLIAWSAMRSASLRSPSGVQINPPLTPNPEDKMLVGAMVPRGPLGGQAAWVIPMEFQF